MAAERDKKAPLGRKVAPSRTRKDGATDVKVPEGKPGNTAMDQTWVKEHEQEFTLLPEDAEVPFGVRMQWSGKAEDVGSHFQIPNADFRCIGRAYVRDAEGRKFIDADGLVLTRPCTKWRMKGAFVCSHHGGLTDGGLAMAKRRLQEAADPLVGRLIALAMSGETMPKDAIAAINSALDRAGLRAGSEIQVDTPGWQGMLKGLFEDGFGAEEEAPAAAPKKAPVKRARKAAKPSA